MKLLLEKWKRFLNESVVTVDFDNTLKMKDTNTANGPIINRIKRLANNGAKIHIVSRRKPSEVYESGFESAEEEIQSFINDYSLPVEQIHLTSWQNKGKIIDELGSETHIDDSDKTWRELEQDYPKINLIKVHGETGRVIDELEEDAKPNPWAICTKSVGRKDKDKYESCVLKVKDQHGIKK